MRTKLFAIAMLLLAASARSASAGTILVTTLPATPCSCHWVLRLVKVPIPLPPTFEETGPRVEPPQLPREADDEPRVVVDVPVVNLDPRPAPWDPWWAVKPVPVPPTERYEWVWMLVCLDGEMPPDGELPPVEPREPPSVPEPSVLALFGLAMIGAIRRRR